jgi:hypothetical protein
VRERPRGAAQAERLGVGAGARDVAAVERGLHRAERDEHVAHREPRDGRHAEPRGEDEAEPPHADLEAQERRGRADEDHPRGEDPRER